MKNSILCGCFALPFVFSVLLALPSYLLPQEIDQSSGLREMKPGCYVQLHRDDPPGVSSTFNNAVIVTKEGVLVMEGQGGRFDRVSPGGPSCLPGRSLLS